MHILIRSIQRRRSRKEKKIRNRTYLKNYIHIIQKGRFISASSFDFEDMKFSNAVFRVFITCRHPWEIVTNGVNYARR